MVITHFSLTALSKSSLNFGLQSFLLCSSFLLENILEQIRLSTSQRFRFLLNRFYPSQDDFSTWNRISKFQRTKTLYTAIAEEREHRTKVRIPYISRLKGGVLRYA